ncbi:hypothetical protein [Oceanobacillus sp. FSL H7-0719]|uniref:hypothetical protein n=1 Tax=Oceanobacillus sp. FSL H7-0719 TaxID=2954507 RepID=UPI003247C49D
MKRILFYVLLFVQAAVLLLLAVQHMLIDDYGTKIRLLQDRQLQTPLSRGEFSIYRL